VLTYARCPRDFYWSVVRPLPAAPKPAARLGAVVHRLLEQRARSLPDLLDADDLGGDRPAGLAAPDLVERASRNFAATRYADLPPPDAEVGVILRLGPWVVRGRIDAVFRLHVPASPPAATEIPAPTRVGDEPPGRPWHPVEGSGPALGDAEGSGSVGVDGNESGAEVELVDWKTGRQPDQAAGGLDQLTIYALGLRELGELPGDRCVVSYCYLGGERPVIESRTLGPADLDRQRALLEAALAALDRGDYQRACGRPDCETCRRGLGPPPRPPTHASRPRPTV
jgi:hypothetical protein